METIMTNKELIKALLTLAETMGDMPGGCGHNVAKQLKTAADRIGQLMQGIGPADRIVELERERHDILHLWYKGRDMCDICAHKCKKVEGESCDECSQDCLCVTCEGENWEEARDE